MELKNGSEGRSCRNGMFCGHMGTLRLSIVGCCLDSTQLPVLTRVQWMPADEILHLVLETLTAALKAAPESAVQWEPHISGGRCAGPERMGASLHAHACQPRMCWQVPCVICHVRCAAKLAGSFQHYGAFRGSFLHLQAPP